MRAVKLIKEFFTVSWRHGVRVALYLAVKTLFNKDLKPRFKFPHAQKSNSAAFLHLLKRRPLVSVVMPVYNSRWLREAVESVFSQSYENWELILSDDGSTLPETLAALEAAAADRRARVLKNGGNRGISAATNAGIAVARGEYIAFMDHDDLLHRDALAMFARVLNAGEEPDVFYTDETRIDEKGFEIAVTRKCRVSLDLLLSCNAVGHLCIMKREALARLGPLKTEYDGAQDHELILRAFEAGMKFYHLPISLYGWRMHQHSCSDGTRDLEALKSGKRPQAYENGKKAIAAYLARHNIKATVTDDGFPWYRVQYEIADRTQEVAIIIPFRDQVQYLQRLLSDLRKTAYQAYRIWLVNNCSQREETRVFLDSLKGDSRISVLDFDEPFNYARLHNMAVAAVPNELLLFMNNDMEAPRTDWLDAMVEHIHRDNVAAVGCKLLRPDRKTLQHAGMSFRPSIYFCACNLTDADDFLTRVQRDVSGVTAACMLIRRSAFLKVGGFDELNFPIGFNDADLCLKLKRSGYKIIYTPFAELIHHESRSRIFQEEAYEMLTLFERYAGDSPMKDPYYHTCWIG